MFCHDSDGYVTAGDHVVGQPATSHAVALKTDEPEIELYDAHRDATRPETFYRELNVVREGKTLAKIPYDFTIYKD